MLLSRWELPLTKWSYGFTTQRKNEKFKTRAQEQPSLYRFVDKLAWLITSSSKQLMKKPMPGAGLKDCFRAWRKRSATYIRHFKGNKRKHMHNFTPLYRQTGCICFDQQSVWELWPYHGRCDGPSDICFMVIHNGPSTKPMKSIMMQ